MNYVKILSDGLTTKVGDISTEFKFQLLDEYRSPTDLTFSNVTIQIATGSTLLIQRLLTVVDEANGVVTFSFEDQDAIGYGPRDIEFIVEDGAGGREVYPSDGYVRMDVQPNLLDRDGSEEIRISLLDLQGTVTSVQAQADALDTEVTTLQSGLSSAQSDISGLNGEVDGINVKLGKSDRDTQTLQYGANVLNGDVSSPATFQIEGKTITSLGNSNLEDGKSYVLADKQTKVKTFKEDTWKQGVAKFQRGQSVTSTADFTGKVSGSVTENPHLFKTTVTNSTTLASPSQFDVEHSATHYENIKTLNGVSSGYSRNSNGQMALALFSFNVIEQIERKHGLIPKTTLADKVQWVKDNVNKLTCNWHGYGSSPTGYKASLTFYRYGSNNDYLSPATHSQGSVSGLTKVINSDFSENSPENCLDSNGFAYFLAHAEPSDGVTASTINTDYVSLDVELKTTASLDKTPILSRIANYEGKVSGSTVENPHAQKVAKDTTLLAPSSNSFTEISQTGYNDTFIVNGIVSNVVSANNGQMAQRLFSIDIIAEIERKLGKIPAADLSAKVQWAKDNVEKVGFGWWGYGSSANGNKCNVRPFRSDTNAWHSTVLTHSNSVVTKLGWAIPGITGQLVGEDGFVHFLAYAEPSDGTTASTINTDYFECEIELKPTAKLWHPSVPLYEVTQAEYDKILVDWTADDVVKRYPRTQGSQHVQNPYVMAEGENLLPPFYEWSLHANASVVSPYELELVKSSTGYNNSEVIVPCVGGKTYTIQGSFTGDLTFWADILDGNGNKIESFANKTSHTFVTGSNAKSIRVVVTSSTVGTHNLSQPMLTLGSVSRPFVPRNPSYLYAETKLGSIGDKKDTLFYEDGAYKRRKVVEKDVVLDGSLAWAFATDGAGFKMVYLSGYSNAIAGASSLVTWKYNGAKMRNKYEVTSETNYIENSRYYTSVSDADTGFTESYTPTSDDIKRYFNGWKRGDGTTWTSVTGNGQTATASTSLSTKPTDYTPYKLSYVLATPKTEVIPHEGAITVNGQTQVEVGSGVVVREKVNPAEGTNDYWINHKTYSSSLLENKVSRVLDVHENNTSVRGESRVIQSSDAHGSYIIGLAKANYDPSAEYTVSYIVLDRHLFTSNPTDVKAMYSRNIRDAHDDLAKLTEDNSTKISVLDRTVYDMLVRLKALEG
jgi:hypothetical protein